MHICTQMHLCHINDFRRATLMVQRLSCIPLQRSSALKGLHRPGMATSSSQALYMADAEEANFESFKALRSSCRDGHNAAKPADLKDPKGVTQLWVDASSCCGLQPLKNRFKHSKRLGAHIFHSFATVVEAFTGHQCAEEPKDWT